jgi:hypothetical protein
LCTYSQDFSNAAWNVSVDSGCSLSITPNYTTASNGLPAARLVASRTNTSTLAILVNYAPNTGTSATKSIWMKNNNAGNVTIMFADEAVTITDTWERYSITNTYFYSIIGLRYSGVALSCDISITGSQFELGSYPTSYIPTTSASVTRNADVISKTGISSLIGQTEGTMFVDINRNQRSQNYNVPIFIGSYSTNNFIQLYFTSSNVLVAQVYTISGQQVAIISSALSSGRYKIAFSYKQNDFAMYINGALIGTSSSGNVPTCSQIVIGNDDIGTTYFGDSINSAMLWKTKLTNDQLAQLTTI